MDGLPTELVIKVLHLALPPIDLEERASLIGISKDYLKALFQLQLVSSRWKEVLDGTPSFWALVSMEFPDRQNTANLDKSSNYPLTVYGIPSLLDGMDKVESCLSFLKLIRTTRPRWRVLWLYLMLQEALSHFLTEPAPILETIHLVSLPVIADNREVFTLFGHHVSTLRSVHLMNIAFYPSPSAFHNIISFHLLYTRGNEVPVEWVMEVLRGSPQMESLRLVEMDLQVPTFSTPVEVINLAHLKSLRITGISRSAIDYIFRRIDVPNCIQFELGYYGQDYDGSLILDRVLSSFEPMIQNLVHKMPNSSLHMKSNNVFWGEFPWLEPGSRIKPYVSVNIGAASFLAIIRWVERVVDPTSSDRSLGPNALAGELCITNTTPLADTEIVSRLKRLKSITAISTESSADVGQLLQLLGEAGPEPSFPSLRQLYLHAHRWQAPQLLEMVRARLSRLPQPVPHLSIVIEEETYPALADPGNTVVFDPDTLHEIRALNGLSLEFAGREDGWESRVVRT
ncbi:hypothetical protein FRC01_005823 [Tulasnella sp. 417]|nr:hypothetical protein FRC01_005823 [Tulasnella sp. 417]